MQAGPRLRENLERDLEHNGAAFAKTWLTLADVNAIAALADAEYARRVSVTASGGAPPVEQAAMWSRRTIPLATLLSMSVIREQIITDPLLWFAAAYLGKSPELRQDSFVRKILPQDQQTHLPFHQDDTIARQRVLNLWIALGPCGENAPSIEIVLGSGAGGLLSVVGPPDHTVPVERARLAEEDVRARYAENRFIRPVFAAGDALIFTGGTIHRTHSVPNMTAPRTSIELRLG